jgi:hypothetical protein
MRVLIQRSFHFSAGGDWMIAPTALGSPLDFLSSNLGARRRAAQRTGLQQRAGRAKEGLVSYPFLPFLCHSRPPQFVRICEHSASCFRIKMIRMRPVDIGGVDGDAGQLLVLQVLNEIRGKEAFVNSTLTVESEIDLLFHG